MTDAELQRIRKFHVDQARIHNLPSVQPQPQIYAHAIFCSASRYKPPGNGICRCFTWLNERYVTGWLTA